MPSSFWWRLPPLPRQKRRIEPGFTPEDLQYLESTLRIIESISIDTNHGLSLGLNEDTAPIENITQPRQMQSDKDTNSFEQARLWIITHPNTVALFLVFIATLLLSRNGVGSLQALVGFGCLVAGLKIMSATEDGFEIPRAAIPAMHIKAEQA